jgi:hypothetical protein
MKNIKSFFNVLILLSFAFLLFSFQAQAQGVVGVKSYNLETVANSVDEIYITGTYSGLLKEFGCNKIDSMIISATVVGEADIDSLDWYPCNWTVGGTKVLGTVKHFTVTLNVAAAGTGTEVLKVTDAGVASTLWRGYEGFAILTRGATAGNDATDPNSLKVTITFYGS